MKNFLGQILFIIGLVFLTEIIKDPNNVGGWAWFICGGLTCWGAEMIITKWIENENKKLGNELRVEIEGLRNEIESKESNFEKIEKRVFLDDANYIKEDGEDEMYEEAQAVVIESGKASTSFLQRKLGIGYARAIKLLDELERRGVIGYGDGTKPRDGISSK